MKVVWFCHTALAGMPYRTARIMDKVLREEGGWARCVCVSPQAYGPRVYPNDLTMGTPEAAEALRDCDVVIVPSYVSGQMFGSDKPVARHLSTERFRWVEQEPSPENHTVVAQYQARFAPGCARLPNCVPITEPMWTPAEKVDPPLVLYTPTSRSTKFGDWACKGYPETITALKRIEKDYRGRVQVMVLENQPYDRVMAARRRASIIIDECATGSYHSTTLEALSCGAATIVRIDDLTQQAIDEMYGTPMLLPVLNTMLPEVEEQIRTLLENPKLATAIGIESRRWMLENYSEEWQAKLWIDWHRSFLRRQ